MDPIFTIITCSYNGSETLRDTLESLSGQTFTAFEHIVVDGGSTDHTLNLLEEYKNKYNLDWISEPDNGIADAMNKGVSLAQGQYLLFVHSDDYLIDKSILEKAAKDIHDSRVNIFRVTLAKSGSQKRSKITGLCWYTNFKMGSCHQGQIIPKSLFDKVGLFDTNLKINMDYDFLLRAYRAGARSFCIDYPISVMRLTGISSRQDWLGLHARILEEKHIHYKNCPNWLMKYIYKLYWTIYMPFRRIKYYSQTG